MLEFLQALIFGNPDTLQCFWPMLLAGAGLGALQYDEQRRQADAQRQLAAATAAYSPWTNLTPDMNIKNPSVLGTVGQGAMMGGIMGASMDSSALAKAGAGSGAGAGTEALANAGGSSLSKGMMAGAAAPTAAQAAPAAQLATQTSTMGASQITPEIQAMYQDPRLAMIQNPEMEALRQNAWLNMPAKNPYADYMLAGN